MNQKIKKSTRINAPKEKVYDVLLNDKFNRIWFSEFGEGVHAETDWKPGSKAVFTDNTKSGLVGRVIVNNPGERLLVEYQGILTDGVEDYDSDIAKSVKGGLENYLLSEVDGTTQLSIECDMSPEVFEYMSLAWDKAVQKIKVLSEKSA